MSKTEMRRRVWLSPMVVVMVTFCSSWIQTLECKCMPRLGCSRALAYYTVISGDTLDALITRFNTTLADVKRYNAINIDSIPTGIILRFPFPCDCEDTLLGYSYSYEVEQDDTLHIIAVNDFEGLSTENWIAQANNIQANDNINPGQSLKVPVNCSCGNPAISMNYGLFTTYPAVSTDNISYLAALFAVDEKKIREYNPAVNWSGNLSTGDIIFIPSQEAGFYPPYIASDDGSSKTNKGLVVGLSVGGAVALLLIILGFLCLLCTFCPRRRAPNMVPSGDRFSGERNSGNGVNRRQSSKEGLKFPGDGIGGSPTGYGTPRSPSAFPDFTVDKSVEFSFEELAAGTNNFNVANKIGEGGFGSVYLANLRGQKLAVKRMNRQATREFLSEIQVLTHVHHTNLVQLIGYCTVDSLFLIYEYVNNGTLDRHLHGTTNLPPLSWPSRVQIALDAARGLEYIHEHTKPSYIHRDVKSSNILIDKQLHAKVGDFGLTKLTESGMGNASLTLPSKLVGTFGYMAPEYAQFGDVSPKVDVYSFGVVLFEIVSAKEAVVRITGIPADSSTPHKEEQRGLVTLFADVLKDVDGREKLQRLVDPSLGSNYPLESAWKMAQLAGLCTQENPELRPSMHNVAVALMTLLSSTQDWEMGGFRSDAFMTGLMSGR